MSVNPVKPALSEPDNPQFLRQLKTIIEILTGRRGNKLTALSLKLQSSAGANPTQAEFNTLAAQVMTLQTRINELQQRLDA